MVIRLDIISPCTGILSYKIGSYPSQIYVPLSKYKTRTSEYDSEELINKAKKDPSIKKMYLYKIQYPDGSISLILNPNEPIGELFCDEPK